MDDWITTEEAANLLRVTRAYISDLIRKGCIVGRRDPPADERSKAGRRVRISRQSVDEYNDTRVRKPLPAPKDISRPGNIPCPWCFRGAASYEDLELHLSIVHPRLLEIYESDTLRPKDFVKHGVVHLAGMSAASGGDG
jgi:hypothetical protein